MDINTSNCLPLDKLRIGSLNVNGFKASIQDILDLCDRCDIVFLQETLLLPFDCHLVNQVHQEFYGIGISNTCIENGVLRGRPVGGLAVLWRKSLNNYIRFTPIKSCEFAVGVRFTLPGVVAPWYMLGVYLPTDYGTLDSLTTYSEALAALECYINSLDSPNILCIGDFNAAFSPSGSSNSRFMRELLQVCEENDWYLLDIELLPADSFTYLSPAHGSTSWIDHFFVSPSMLSNSFQCEVLYDVSPLDHMPIIACISLPGALQGEKHPEASRSGYRADWRKASSVERDLFTLMVDCDVIQMDWDSFQTTDLVYKKLVDILLKAEKCFIPKQPGSKGLNRGMPGWNEQVKEAYAGSRKAFLAWKNGGKPRVGPLYLSMCSARKVFKKAFRECKASVTRLRDEKLGEVLLTGDSRGFWKAVNKLSPRPQLPSSIEGVSGATKIANYWGRFYETRYATDEDASSFMRDQGPCGVDPKFFTKAMEVKNLVMKLDLGKAPGPDGLSAHLLKNCPDSVFDLLSDLFNYSLFTGTLPGLLKLGRLVPVVKNKQGDLTATANYRGICVSSLLAKVFEKIILRHISPCLETSPAQFGFKASHDTTLATFAVENIIEQYNKAGSPVYAAFLDASQAFDNVSHSILFQLLRDRGVPECFVRLLKNWYYSGELHVSWSNALSENFCTGKGVRQGSCLSPYLFNIYIDHLIKQVRQLPTGCAISGVPCNIVAYADDLLLLAPSFRGLQTLLNACDAAALRLNIRFNPSKCAFVFFNGYLAAHCEPPTKPLCLQGSGIPPFLEFTHLGHILHSDLTQGSDIGRARRAFFRMLNVILSRFHSCSVHIKVALFRAFCLHLYGCELWSRLTVTQKRELGISLHTALKRVGGYTRYSRNSLACMDMGLLTMDRQVAFRQLSFFKRVMSSPNEIVQAVTGHRNAFNMCFFQHVQGLCKQFGMLNVGLRDTSNAMLKHFMWCHMEKYILTLPEVTPY